MPSTAAVGVGVVEPDTTELEPLRLLLREEEATVTDDVALGKD